MALKTPETWDGRRCDPVTRHLLAGLLVVLAFADAASAGLLGIEVEQKPNEFVNLTCNVYAVFDGTGPNDALSTVAGIPGFPLNISVTNGTFYQHPFGTDRAPNCFLIPAFPDIEFDTFVTIGVKCDDGTDTTGLMPGWAGFGPSSIGGDDLAWFATPPNPQTFPDATGRVLLGQFSTDDGEGVTGIVLLQVFSDGVALLALDQA